MAYCSLNGITISKQISPGCQDKCHLVSKAGEELGERTVAAKGGGELVKVEVWLKKGLLQKSTVLQPIIIIIIIVIIIITSMIINIIIIIINDIVI